jgi:hypothetical protein
MNDKPSLLTPEQAAQTLNLPTSRLARWRSKGVGPNYIKIEGRVLYDMAALTAFLDVSRVQPGRNVREI